MNEEAEMELASLVKELDYRITDALGNEASEKETAAALRTEITGITNDSRQVSSGKLFFCIPGANSDGHDFAQKAADAGAAALGVSRDVDLAPARQAQPVIVRTKDTRLAMALISAAFYGYPARSLRMIGVTGTKGKTTTTYLVRAIPPA